MTLHDLSVCERVQTNKRRKCNHAAHTHDTQRACEKRTHMVTDMSLCTSAKHLFTRIQNDLGMWSNSNALFTAGITSSKTTWKSRRRRVCAARDASPEKEEPIYSYLILPLIGNKHVMLSRFPAAFTQFVCCKPQHQQQIREASRNQQPSVCVVCTRIYACIHGQALAQTAVWD